MVFNHDHPGIFWATGMLGSQSRSSEELQHIAHQIVCLMRGTSFSFLEFFVRYKRRIEKQE